MSGSILEYSSIERSSKLKTLPAPLGFPVTYTTGSSKSKDKQQPSTKSEALTPKEKAARYEDLKSKRAWDLATSPAKQLPMQMIMVYFSGGGVQIFSMGMVAMLLSSPFKAVAGMNEAFAQFAPVDAADPRAFTTLLLPKLAYIVCNILTLLVGMYKCNQMGLLPVGTGDWLAFEQRGESPDITFH
ncbi:hypothetical protein PIIN_04742 [Serendipita indica DSM 11827]|uniref:ER membrane protein complex subunit 4 n=1 Tax=Serendipita indica (strain DSM 11827) TaxID=1109443 RepID=G4THL2_SERID|nr:hypothetical protein PIIN_04742 [Serendipita indica DSM 11827]